MLKKQSRLEEVQQEVEEVRVIMQDNLIKAQDREENLEELDKRADEIEKMSKTFAKTAGRLKRKKQCENMKVKVVLGIIAGIVILTFIMVLSLLLAPKDENSGAKEKN